MADTSIHMLQITLKQSYQKLPLKIHQKHRIHLLQTYSIQYHAGN